MRLGLVTGLWGRSELSRIVLKHFASLEVPGVELVRVAVWSPEDDEAANMYEMPGWTFTEFQNMPYSDKFNRGFRVLKGRVDAAMVFGSDDLISASYIRHAARLIAEGRDMIQPEGLHFYDLASGRCIFGTAKRIGGGRVLSARLLDMLAWRPYKPGLSRTLDLSMEKRTSEFAFPYRVKMDHGRVLLAVKSRHNIWDFDAMKHLAQRDEDGEALLAEHFPDVASDILAMRENVVLP
jgi:hypothetical protein